jgi:hypothetical protein
MGDLLDWESDQLFDVFGGWSNVMQGFGGTLVAVVGAFAVARWTVHNELKRQDERARAATGVEAAGQILMAIASYPESLRKLEHLDFDQNGINYRHVTEWEMVQKELLTQLRLHGMLLPPTLEAQATKLAGSVGRILFDIDADEEAQVLNWVGVNGDRVEAAIDRAEATLA